MIRTITSLLLGVSALIVLTGIMASPFSYTNASQKAAAQSIEGIPAPERAPANYWLIKSLSMRAIGCLCANKYPVGLGAGKESAFTYRVLKNEQNQEVAIYALCIKMNKEWNKRVLGMITLPLTVNGQVQIETPGDDRNNANAAALRESLQGAVVVPFRRQSYRLSRCPTNRDHYQGLNWSQPELWPAM